MVPQVINFSALNLQAVHASSDHANHNFTSFSISSSLHFKGKLSPPHQLSRDKIFSMQIYFVTTCFRFQMFVWTSFLPIYLHFCAWCDSWSSDITEEFSTWTFTSSILDHSCQLQHDHHISSLKDMTLPAPFIPPPTIISLVLPFTIIHQKDIY